MTEENKERVKQSAAPGIAILGCNVTGGIACFGGIVGIFSHQIAGAGVCLSASAIAFGIVAFISFAD